MPIVRMQNRVKLLFKTIALIAFVGYVVWNVLWLSCGCIPPSIWSYWTGLPCATTGMCRSILSLCYGDFSKVFLFNPFTLPYIILIFVSGGLLLRQYCREQTMQLPPTLARLWLFIIILSWATKFIISREYW